MERNYTQEHYGIKELYTVKWSPLFKGEFVIDKYELHGPIPIKQGRRHVDFIYRDFVTEDDAKKVMDFFEERFVNVNYNTLDSMERNIYNTVLKNHGIKFEIGYKNMGYDTWGFEHSYAVVKVDYLGRQREDSEYDGDGRHNQDNYHKVIKLAVDIEDSIAEERSSTHDR